MAELWVLPYNINSESAKKLAEAIGSRRIKSDNSRFIHRPNRVVINWGHNAYPEWMKEESPVLNNPNSVLIATNKLSALQVMLERGVSVPEFTVDKAEAVNWGSDLIIRTILRGHGGEGTYYVPRLSIAERVNLLNEGKLFTKYIKKTAEYRVHVFDGEVRDVQQKKKRTDLPNDNVDFQIRNAQNGWVFCREGIEVPDAVKEQAILAVNALGLDFGAVDVIWNQVHGAFVLEVNTAPGIEGSTLETYATYFKEKASA